MERRPRFAHSGKDPARLPDGDLPEQGGDHAVATIMQDALRPAAGASTVEGTRLVDLVLHEAQLQLMQQVLGFSKTKAEVGRVGR